MMRTRKHVNPLSKRPLGFFKDFLDDKDVLVEIGAAEGEFIEQLIKKYNTTYNFIIFEIKEPLAKKIRENFSSYKNIQVLSGDAAQNILYILKNHPRIRQKIAKIFINFPDPWLKKKHHKRRCITNKFLKQWGIYGGSQAEFIFQTDQVTLMSDTQNEIKKLLHWNIAIFHESAEDIPTKWEKQKQSEGVPIWRMKFMRK